jgi:pimeloyl-ACP methyl ester carboxylesterase
MATFILIPGGWQGGWVYQKVADILTARGHKALPITLSGLGDAPAPTANLESHIGEVVDVVKSQRDELVIVGQSYGGMIVSGAADAEPSKVRALVYVDAYVPDSGDSVWSLTPRKTFIGAHGWEGSPFLELYRRLSDDPDWSTSAFDCGHNVARLKPEALSEILLAQV